MRLERRDAAALPPLPGEGLLTVNPPYGLRLEEGAEEAWRALGAVLEGAPGWRAAVLGPSSAFARLLGTAPGGRPVEGFAVRNGGLACKLYLVGRPPRAAARSPSEQGEGRAKR